MLLQLSIYQYHYLRIGGKRGWWGCGLWVTGQSQGQAAPKHQSQRHSQGLPGDSLQPFPCIQHSVLLQCSWDSNGWSTSPKVISFGLRHIRNGGRNAELAHRSCLVCLGCLESLGSTCTVVTTILICNINWWQGTMPVMIMRHHHRTGYHYTHKQLMHWRLSTFLRRGA